LLLVKQKDGDFGRQRNAAGNRSHWQQIREHKLEAKSKLHKFPFLVINIVPCWFLGM